jgi:hypothetical protein
MELQALVLVLRCFDQAPKSSDHVSTPGWPITLP